MLTQAMTAEELVEMNQNMTELCELYDVPTDTFREQNNIGQLVGIVHTQSKFIEELCAQLAEAQQDLNGRKGVRQDGTPLKADEVKKIVKATIIKAKEQKGVPA